MKNRSKMILGLASMLGISAGATAVSGFAWFTTQRTAEIGASNFVVGAAEGNLSISKHTAVEGDIADANLKADGYTVANNVCAATPTADKELADVSSGDGKNFYKATVVDSGTKDGENIVYVVDQVKPETGTMSSINTNQMVYVQWSLDVKNTGNVAVDVYLSAETLFKKHEGAANDYSAYYRLAIYQDTNSSGTVTSNLVFLYTNASHKNFISATDYSKHYATDATKAVCPLDGTGVLGTSDCMTSLNPIHKTADIQGGVALTTASKNNQLLVKGLTGTKTLRFVVWCEGTATPEGAVAGNSVDMAFQLVGLTA